MSKLIGTIAALALVNSAGATKLSPASVLANSAVSKASQEGGAGKRTLARLDARAVEGTLDANGAAAILFAEEVDVTTAVLEALNRRRTAGASGTGAVERLVSQVPAVAVSVLALPDLSEAEGLRVAGVALEVLEHRGARAGGLRAFSEVLEGAAERGGAQSLGRAVQEVVSSVAADGALDGASLLELVNAARPSLSLDVLQSAATGLAA
ncbi:MAG: hypothetical protein AAGG01_01140, partial [Planctomycetota bacterium]